MELSRVPIDMSVHSWYLMYMNVTKKLPITTFRNNLFNYLNEVYLQKSVYVVEKGNIPIAYVIPANNPEIIKYYAKDALTDLIEDLKETVFKMNKSVSSVDLIREMRLNG